MEGNTANHALQRTRPLRYGCNPPRPADRVDELGSLGALGKRSRAHFVRFAFGRMKGPDDFLLGLRRRLRFLEEKLPENSQSITAFSSSPVDKRQRTHQTSLIRWTPLGLLDARNLVSQNHGSEKQYEPSEGTSHPARGERIVGCN
jgi:hypothetical protein